VVGAVKEAPRLTLICLVLATSAATASGAETKKAAKASVHTPQGPAPVSQRVGERAEAKAKDADEKKKQAESKGKTLVAGRLFDLAAIWRKVAAAEVRAAEVEEKSRQVEEATLEIQARWKRAKALIEQTEARRSRAFARLQKLGLDDASPQSEANALTEDKETQAETK
jgi:hypothetical protein